MTLDNLILRNKCIILGNCGVGKSAISQVFHSDGQFPKNYTPTIHEEIYVKMMNIVDNQNINVELFIHDVSGHDLFNEFLPKYIEGANSFILVYDITNQESFQNLSKWLQFAKKSRPGKSPLLGLILANKVDLVNRRCISTKQGEDYAKSQNLGYFECSAMNTSYVEPIFVNLCNSYVAKYNATLNRLNEL